MQYQVIIPIDLIQPLETHELTAAILLTKHFQCHIYVQPKRNRKSADFIINNTHWELKSPIGTGSRTIQRNLQWAIKQSDHIIIDTRRSKMHSGKIIARIRAYLKQAPQIKHLIVITKSKQIIDFHA